MLDVWVVGYLVVQVWSGIEVIQQLMIYDISVFLYVLYTSCLFDLGAFVWVRELLQGEMFPIIVFYDFVEEVKVHIFVVVFKIRDFFLIFAELVFLVSLFVWLMFVQKVSDT